MKRILIVLVILAAAWSAPQSRARIVQWTEPLLVRLGPAGERVIAPTRVIGARNEVRSLVRQLVREREQGRRLPTEDAFTEWVRVRVRGVREGRDPWGSEYYLIHMPGSITVGSPGPDRRRGTDDDILVTQEY